MIFNSLKSRIIISVAGIVIASLAIIIFFFGREAGSELSDAIDANALNLLNATKNHVESLHNSIAYHKTVMISRRKKELKNSTAIASAIVNRSYREFINGTIGEESAKLRAIDSLRELRYDDGIGYFWINDTGRPYPRMIMHPIIAELNGKILDDEKFNTAAGSNKNLFKLSVDLCLKKNAGYIHYLWSKPVMRGLSKPKAKISYVELFKEWNWIIGSGVYMDDIDRDVQRRINAVIRDLNETIIKQKIGESGYFFIFNEKNVMLVHPNLAGKNVSNNLNPVTGNSIIEEFKKAALSSDQSIEYLWDKPGFSGEYRFSKKAFVSYYKPLGWYICSSVYKEDFERVISDLLGEIMIFAGLFLAVALTVSLLVSRSIANPLNRLVRSIGNTDEEGIPVSTMTETGSIEVRVLISTINNMIGSIRRSGMELKAQRDFSMGIINGAPDLICGLNTDGTAQFINPAGEKTTGYSKDEIIGKKWIELFYAPEDRSRAELLFEKVCRGEQVNFEMTLICRSGKQKNIVWNFVNRRDSLGRIVEVTGFGNDITVRKRVEEDLRLNESRLDALVTLGQMTSGSLKSITDFVLEEAVRLTGSTIGYLAFVNESETVLTMHSWSKTAMAECMISDKPVEYHLDSMGLWGESVRQRKPIITNDYAMKNPLKKGYPRGHVNITRHMNIPVFDGGRIVAVAGVGNKKGEYNRADVRQLTLLLEGMWRSLQRKQAEENLKRSEAEYRSTLNNLLVGVVVHDGRDTSILMSNPVARKLLGLTEDQMSGKKAVDTSWNFLNRDSSIMAVSDYPVNRVKSTESAVHDSVLGINIPENDFITWVNVNAVPLFSADGEMKKIIVNFADITKLKKIDEDLRRLRNYQSNIIDSMPSVLVGVDSHCQVTQWNRTAEQVTGITANRAQGKLISELYPQIMIKRIKKSIETREIQRELNSCRRTDDGTIYEDVTIYPLVANGVSGAVLRIDDVTKKHELEEQLSHSRKMDAIGQLAGGIAHDFNNMLAGIMGAAQLLKSPKLNIDKKGVKYIDMILKAAERASELTSGLLAFGRKGRIVSTVVDVHSILEDAVDILSRTIDKNIKISIKKDAENFMAVGDSSRLQNAFMNIGINAGHAMPGGGELQIETRNIRLDQIYCEASTFEIEPGEYIEIEIRDTGIGIPLENIQKIFEPFYTTKDQGEGTGLGLAAVYGTVQDHHGVVNVYSEKGVGTSFHIMLPCSESNMEQKKSETGIVKGSGQVLLVDDEELIRVTGKYMLQEMGYSVILAGNGQEALDIFRDNYSEIDIVVMDMIMPKMNGREAFHKMKEIDKNCRVIISSGFAQNESVDELIRSGLSGFIHKPYRDFELSRLMAKVLKI